MENPDPKILQEIEELTQEKACYLWRFSPSGHPFFDGSKPYWPLFKAKFKQLGGFTPEISKKIGWEK